MDMPQLPEEKHHHGSFHEGMEEKHHHQPFFEELLEGKHRPSLEEVFIDLLESIALEETAISRMMNAEADKLKAFVGIHLNFPTYPDNEMILKMNTGVTRLIETLMFKELFLLRKLETVSLLAQQNVQQHHQHEHEHEHEHHHEHEE